MKFFRRILKTDKNFTKTPWKTAKKLRTVTWWEQTQSIEKAKKTKFILKKKQITIIYKQQQQQQQQQRKFYEKLMSTPIFDHFQIYF